MTFLLRIVFYRECEIWNYKTGTKIKKIKNTSGGTVIGNIPNTTHIIYRDISSNLIIYNYETDILLNSIYIDHKIKKIFIENESIYIGSSTDIYIYSMDLTLQKKITGYSLIYVDEYIITERQGYFNIFNKDTYYLEKQIRYVKTYITNKNIFVGKKNNILYFTKMDEIDPTEIIQKHLTWKTLKEINFEPKTKLIIEKNSSRLSSREVIGSRIWKKDC